ncbi:branched-chain amino acid ABC transporter permease [Actinoplanes sp. NBRC 101535]|nr:branched-chain amino acid ABC transporter permease [Actinoplanes sp. NBRC 101535]
MKRCAAHGVFAAVVLSAPALFTRMPFYTLSTAVLMVMLAIGALGLVPLTGLARQVSLGQAAFYGIGGYTSAVLSTRYGIDGWTAMACGAVLAGALAWLLGLAIFRAQGHYLTLATLALGIALSALAGQLPVTGRNAGVAGIPPLEAFGIRLDGDLSVFYAFAGMLVLCVLAVDCLLRSGFGRALTAAGDSPLATAGSGVDIARLRRAAFVLAAVLASIAGSGYAYWYRYIDPGIMGLLSSVELLIIVTVGGTRSVWGPALGAFTVISLSQLSKQYLPGTGGTYELTIYGAALILTLLLLPDGLVGAFAAAGRTVRHTVERRRTAATARALS